MFASGACAHWLVKSVELQYSNQFPLLDIGVISFDTNNLLLIKRHPEEMLVWVWEDIYVDINLYFDVMMIEFLLSGCLSHFGPAGDSDERADYVMRVHSLM